MATAAHAQSRYNMLQVMHIVTTMPDEAQCWRAIELRDAAFDGVFFYGVRTTGVFCRPSCASRQPRRANVAFFASAEAAEAAGFRPCQRCHPCGASPNEVRVELIAAICRYLEQPHERIPTLAELAAQFHLSPYHLQRSFKRVTGVSPRQYADSHRQQRVRQHLKAGVDVGAALYDAGYGSSSAFYAQASDSLGMRPTTYRAGGASLELRYASAPCSLGCVLLAATDRGICSVTLGDNEAALLEQLQHEFPRAHLQSDPAGLQPWLATLLEHLDGAQPALNLPLDIQATAFQRTVWEALRGIPYGETISYGELARRIGRPTATRAVAQACATNPVALINPCQRVVRGNGELGGYRWGVERKRAILDHEAETVSG